MYVDLDKLEETLVAEQLTPEMRERIMSAVRIVAKPARTPAERYQDYTPLPRQRVPDLW